MSLHKILNELENIDMEQREYRQAVEALVAAEDYFMEVLQQRDNWTYDQVVAMRRQAGVDQALTLLAAVTPLPDDYDEEDLADEDQTIDD